MKKFLTILFVSVLFVSFLSAGVYSKDTGFSKFVFSNWEKIRPLITGHATDELSIVSEKPSLSIQDTVSACGSLNVADTVYNLDQNVGSTGTCFTIDANNVTLDCHGFTINLTVPFFGIGRAIQINEFNNSLIKNCFIDLQGSMPMDVAGIFVSGSGNIVTNNTINSSISAAGISIAGLENIINSNTLDMAQGSGISINQGAYSNNLSANNITIFANSALGINLPGYNNAFGTIIEENTITAYGDDSISIVLSESSNHHRVYGNNISSYGANSYGLSATYGGGYGATGTTNNSITGNVIFTSSSNSVGMSFISSGSPSDPNKVYNNRINSSSTPIVISGSVANFYNTTLQAGTNIIGGPNIGGNFYANSSGTGFSETCVDGNADGICDSSNAFDGSNVDYLPLANYVAAPPATNLSCGDPLNVADTVYYLNNSVNSSGTCFIIGANNVTLDCAGYSITGDTTGYGVNNSAGYDYVTVKNCNISSFEQGINFENVADNGTIINNTVSLSTTYGIRIYSGSFNTVSENTAQTSTSIGIYITSGLNNSFVNNTIDSNQYGLYFNGVSNYNTIVNNSFVSNVANGVYSDSSYNTFYNNFFNNTNSILLETGPVNDWNTTLIAETNILGRINLGGNYWATPTGTGFSETCIDYDNNSICDSQYNIDGSNIDYLPLTLEHSLRCTTLAVENATFNLEQNLNSVGTCFTIGANNVTLDCQGYAVLGDSSGYGIDNGAGYDLISVKNCNISNFNNGIYFGNVAENGSIINNTASSNGNNGIYLLTGCSNNNITSNNAHSNSNYGIVLEDSSNSNSIINNNASLNNFDGIRILYSSNNFIIENNVSSNLNSGIVLYSSAGGNILRSNIASSNINYGIYLESGPNNNIVDNNTIDSNSYGIYVGSSSNNNFTNNTITSSSNYGFYLASSLYNLIYNNFFNNTNNAVSDGNYNDLNTTLAVGTNIAGGPNIGGNFYASPTGDGFSEPCTDANGDRICDVTNIIASSNIDYLPLASAGSELPERIIYAISAADPDPVITANSNGTIRQFIQMGNYIGEGITVDSSGNTYTLGDEGLIMKITPNGTISSFANVSNYSVNNWFKITIEDSIKTLYAINYNTGQVIKINSDGTTSQLADLINYSGSCWSGIVANRGDVYAFTCNGPIIKITSEGATSQFADLGGTYWSWHGGADSFGNFYAMDYYGNLNNITANGTITSVTTIGISCGIYDIASDGPGNVYALDYCGQITKITPDVTVTSFASASSIGSAWTGITTARSAPQMAQCGDSLNNSYTLYTLNQSLSSPGATCITIAAEGVTLDCDGNALTGDYTGNGIDTNGYNLTTIKNCNISNFNNGIYLSSGSNSLIENNVVDSNNYGLALDFGESNTIKGNRIISNVNNGISLTSSSSNKIYNNIFNNSANLIADSSSFWNTTLAAGTNIVNKSFMGGNFWANPSGTGFSEDPVTCFDRDNNSICDSSNALGVGGVDYLPLTTQPLLDVITGDIPSGFVLNKTFLSDRTRITLTGENTTIIFTLLINETVNLTGASITSIEGLTTINGLDLPSGVNKSVSVTMLTGSNSICIDDNDGATLSANCTETGEVIVSCPGTTDAYNCKVTSLTPWVLTVSNLTHSTIGAYTGSASTTTTTTTIISSGGGRGKTFYVDNSTTTIINSTTVLPAPTLPQQIVSVASEGLGALKKEVANLASELNSAKSDTLILYIIVIALIIAGLAHLSQHGISSKRKKH